LTASTAITAAPNLSSQPTIASPPAPTASSTDYTAELLSLKAEILSICNIITEAVAQLKSAIASYLTPSIATPHATMALSAMETEVDYSTATTLDISDLIVDLKHDIATIAIEMHAKFQQQATIYSTTKHAPP